MNYVVGKTAINDGWQHSYMLHDSLCTSSGQGVCVQDEVSVAICCRLFENSTSCEDNNRGNLSTNTSAYGNR